MDSVIQKRRASQRIENMTPEQIARRNARNKEWQRKRKARRTSEELAAIRLKDREAHLWKCYKITLAEYDTMLEAQGGGCAICGKAGDLHVDHNHSTSQIRGLLCHGCNTGIGLLTESAATLSSAIAYLEAACRSGHA